LFARRARDFPSLRFNLFLSQDFLHPLLERRKIALDHIPDNYQVNAKVLMHDDISEPAAKAQTSAGYLLRKSIDSDRQASPMIIK
jgi:hypothetical protein